MKTRRLIYFILLLFIAADTYAQQIQRYNCFSYSVNEGLLQSTISDMAFDKNNFCWLGFPNGIQKFDGKNFTIIPVQPGLPDDKIVHFFKCANADLLIGHSQGISKYEITSNRFVHVYKSFAGAKMPPAFIGEDDAVIYFYLETGEIVGINNKDFHTVSKTRIDMLEVLINSDYRPKFSDNIIDHRVTLLIKNVFYLWDLKKGKLISRSPVIPEISSYLLRMKSANEVFYCSYTINNSLQLYNLASNTSTSLLINGKSDELISRCIIYPWQNKLLISFNGKLYETDSTLQVLHSEIVNFQNQPIGGASSIGTIKEDNFGNLYFLTVTNGIKKIIRNNYPIKYYGTVEKENNNILSILPDKENNRVLAGTSGGGLLVFDTLQHLIKQIKTVPGSQSTICINNILKIKEGYLIFSSGSTQVWQISKDLSSMKPVKVESAVQGRKVGMQYFGNPLFQDDRHAITQTQGKVYKTVFNSARITEYEITTSYAMGGILHNGNIITHANNQLIFLDTATFSELKTIPFKNTGYVRCFAKDAAGNVYIGSNKGIFKIDGNGNILSQLKKETGLPDECIYAIAFDEKGFLWCSSNKGIFKISSTNNILQLKKEDGLQENEFNTNVVAKSADGEMFFGGVNGVSSFYPSAISNFEENVNILLTRVRVNNEDVSNDTATWNISSIDLPYNKSSLSFDFIAMANNNPDQYLYQYRMEGVDDQWIQNSDLQTVRYFLPPGKYVFKVYASRFFDKDAKAMKEIHINIRPPFWKTWWFIAGILILIVGITAYLINRFNKNKYQKKMMELESEHRMQLERERISRDLHDSIGAYANAVLYNTEQLEKQTGVAGRQELMSDLKFASKDIIASLRETIWALKKTNYSAEDCLLRIKNFIQPLARYYPHIHFKIEGIAPSSLQFHYTKALNIVRIVQEAVTNSIKHATAKNIHLQSSDEGGTWELVISDDGKGFDYKAEKDLEAGNGLINMQHRSNDSGLDLVIESDPGKGTQVKISS